MKESSTNNLNRTGLLSKCPVTFTLERIGGRWKPIILWQLRERKLRYSEIRRGIPPISEKMLIQQLKELEADGLVVRESKPVVPPYVEYSLSADGEAIRKVLEAMADWGIRMQEKENSAA